MAVLDSTFLIDVEHKRPRALMRLKELVAEGAPLRVPPPSWIEYLAKLGPAQRRTAQQQLESAPCLSRSVAKSRAKPFACRPNWPDAAHPWPGTIYRLPRPPSTFANPWCPTTEPPEAFPESTSWATRAQIPTAASAADSRHGPASAVASPARGPAPPRTFPPPAPLVRLRVVLAVGALGREPAGQDHDLPAIVLRLAAPEGRLAVEVERAGRRAAFPTHRDEPDGDGRVGKRDAHPGPVRRRAHEERRAREPRARQGQPRRRHGDDDPLGSAVERVEPGPCARVVRVEADVHEPVREARCRAEAELNT